MPGSHGTFYWNELMTRDVAQSAKKFYADTLGWSFDAYADAAAAAPIGSPRWTTSRSAAFSTSAAPD